MKGIYLTEEGRQELLKRIDGLKEMISFCVLPHQQSVKDLLEQELFIKEEILSSATILPVEESWDNLSAIRNRLDNLKFAKEKYPNGVIIQPKE
jgi:hypothetical protein